MNTDMTVRRHRVAPLLLGCLMWQFAASGWAQNYPAKVVRYLVPTPAGSGADTIGRIVAGGLSQVFGQQVVVDNRAGGGNNIGAEIAAKAPPDGYTVFQATLTHAVNATLYRKLAYDLVRDFAPVTQLAASPYVLVVHPSLPVKSAAELVKLAKARPGAINFASAGPGTATFLAGELFKDIAEINMLHVPYRGGGEALTSVISGETSVYFAPVAIALPFIKEGRFRPLAVTTAQRLPALPSYPTVAEAGYPGYLAGNWFGLMVPAKTPKATIATIRAAAISVLKDADVARRLRDLGYVLIGDQPEEFGAHVRSEIERLGKIVRRAGVTVD
ncbi:MAG: tripartite tricarboxylate transporter substrate binding protein [Betaproteobacteria bacterium]|nr:tripartite tricarboxylate transporter substrate binding protein [Betaproteobacteria bacterium]